MKHLEIFGGFVFLLNFAGRKQKNSILLKKKKMCSTISYVYDLIFG